jgi:heme-degrading monooxygenase HmoA
MFIAMNRFKVLKDATAEFENAWLSRESHLHEVPGFLAFHLLKGPEREDHVLYASHTMWASYADFEAWTRSEAFRKAHATAGGSKPTTLGHPKFEGFEAIQEVTADGAVRRPAAE